MPGTKPWTGTWSPAFATSEKLAIQKKRFEGVQVAPLSAAKLENACDLVSLFRGHGS
jgi:hypothetical protein